MPDPEDVTPQTNTAQTTQKTANNGTTNKGDVLKAQDLNDPLHANQTNTTVNAANVANNGGGGGDMPGAGDPLSQRLAAWAPAITKVSDPVAFMTSASLNSKGKVDGSKGSYDQAIYDPKSAGGFYEQAKAECRRLEAEIRTFQQSGVTGTQQTVQLEMLASFLAAYAEMYTLIQGAGSLNAKKQQEATIAVRGALVKAQGFYAGVPKSMLGGGAAQIEGAMAEIGVFVESWNIVAGQSANTEASSQMSSLFLQTNERSRQILNEYDLLDDRGGDTTGTAHMAVFKKNGGAAKGQEEGKKVIAEGGGVMAQALRSYGRAAGNNEAMKVQVDEVIARLRAGEFKSEAECVAAFRKHVGGGRASEAFYKELEKVARGHWQAYLAGAEADQQAAANEQARQSQANAQVHMQNAGGFIGQRDMNARNGEDNIVRLDMTSEDMVNLGKDVTSGQTKVVNPNYGPNQKKEPGDFQFKPYEDAQTAMKNGTYSSSKMYGQYNQYGDLISVSGQDTSFAMKSGVTDEEYIRRGKGALTEQELGYQAMDQKKTELAYQNAMLAQEQAKQEVLKAKQELAAGESHLQSSLQHYLNAQAHITEARAHAARVKSKNPAIQSGLSSLETELQKVEQRLAQNEEIRKQIDASQKLLEGKLAELTKNIETYTPEQMKVPVPTASPDGSTLESERYEKLTIDLTGPAWGVFEWLGGLEGAYATIDKTKGGQTETWKKASIEIYAGLQAELWLLRAGVKLKGSFEAEKKDAEGLIDTLYSGADELGRWAYAWWYDLRSMSGRVGAAIDHAIGAGSSVYGVMLAASRQDGLVRSEIDQASEEMEEIHAKLAGQLMAVFGKSELDMSQGVELADSVLPVEEVQRGLRALEGAGDAAPGELEKARGSFRDVTSKGKSDAMADVARVDPGKNDPNVKFKAGVGIEGFVELGWKDEPALALSVSQVYSITDGDKEDFDYSTHSETKVKGKFKVAGVEVEVALGQEDGDWKGGIEIMVPMPIPEGLDGTKAMLELQAVMTACKGEDARGWVEHMSQALKQVAWAEILMPDITSRLGPEGKLEGSAKAKIGGELKLKDDFSYKSSSVTFGIVTKMEAGNSNVKIGYEQGNMVSWKNGD